MSQDGIVSLVGGLGWVSTSPVSVHFEIAWLAATYSIVMSSNVVVEKKKGRSSIDKPVIQGSPEDRLQLVDDIIQLIAQKRGKAPNL